MFNEMCPDQLEATSLVTRPYSVKLDILGEEKEGRGGRETSDLIRQLLLPRCSARPANQRPA